MRRAIGILSKADASDKEELALLLLPQPSKSFIVRGVTSSTVEAAGDLSRATAEALSTATAGAAKSTAEALSTVRAIVGRSSNRS